MSKPKVWVSRPFFPDIVDRLREHFDVRAEAEDRPFSPAELTERLADADAAIVGLVDRIDADALAKAPKLRFVANLGVGYNNLDLDALTARGVGASNTPDVLNETVADYAWALMLAAARRVGEAERWLRDGQWKGSRFEGWLGADVHGKTIGILGMGRIGQAIARRAMGFRAKVIYHNRSRLDAAIEQECAATYVDKATLLAQADHLILVLPFTPANRHTIGEAELRAMKPTATLTNIARGGIVDDAALARALADGVIASAALDVFEGEPQVHPDLLKLGNIVLSPHIASASRDTRRDMASLAVDNVLAAFGHGPHAGRPPTILNPGVLADAS
ncbi:D-glycerate dehydrogenase [Luteibacter anthropi]|uniref:D-glycerate dehydrogenase n=1 Tax=Luteibacter anthropi TaxID=564369 RepID=A0A7X5ZIT6_9GAMM|nr:D-glycerate dehydrogenase [Luteibacter anthropi]NII07010.1 D-glycerate dehydrogenase [Luteibacter anthropi]URX61391.1 D-glycerate dehydrogenase [Luteibacter anthropi]